MDAVHLLLQNNISTVVLASVIVGFLTVAILIAKLLSSGSPCPNHPPGVPGLPLIGNLHQLKDKKPHQTFAKWAEIYGPIYTIRTGTSTVVVLNSTQVAKEAMVTRFSSISTRKLSKALTLLTSNKAMVATSDYGDFHKMVKRYILSSVLGANAQAVGEDVGAIYVEELGKEMSKKEIFEVLVVDPMMGAIDVDWRDFFPYLKWIPNRRLENKIQGMATRKKAVTRALIIKQKKRIAQGEERDCYLDFLLKENTLTEEQLTSLVWEAIIEASDTTLVTTEWAMFELAKNPACQDRLYHEIQEVCGSQKATEEHLSQMPFLNAVFHETLRFHSPVPIVPLRYAHEDTQIGGYNIQAGSEIAINLYACNMDKHDWDKPLEWWPERFLDGKFEQMDMQKTMAFGAGKRVCAGSLQAMLISCTAIARLVQEFHWRLKEGEEANFDTVQLTTHKRHPMHAYIRPREMNFA